MGKQEENMLRQLENQLISCDAAEAAPAQKVRAENTDRADVDMEDYSRRVEAGKRRGRGLLWLLLLVAAAAVAYILYRGGVLPWK